MKYLGLLLFFLSALAHGSYTPVSGTFSNVRADSADDGFNLVVTVTSEGQQFFLQCFKGGKPAFGTTTSLRHTSVEAVVDAGPDCPARKVRIRLDFEEAWIDVDGKWVPLPRGDIVIPIVD